MSTVSQSSVPGEWPQWLLVSPLAESLNTGQNRLERDSENGDWEELISVTWAKAQ